MIGSHGVGHTRMATESAVTTLGAHPFSTGEDQCLVHNGSLSNHNSLRPKLVVGFAAETNSIKNNSLKKLSEKNCDWIIANDVSKDDIGFESDFNKVSIFYKNNSEENLPKMRKSSVANEIVNRIIAQLN